MDSPIAMLKFLGPQLPSLASTAVWHSLGRSDVKEWDLRTAMTVQVLRSMMSGGGKPRSVVEVQSTMLKDPGIKGKMWIAKATMPAPKEQGVREKVFEAVEQMKVEGAGDAKYTPPELADVEVEWTGYRPGAGKDEAMPDISEEEKYKRLMDEPSRTSETTILNFHGGAYYLCDPITHRLQCSRLAKESKGRVVNVRYRLAPQTAFPGQLIDALLVYLSLIYPPPGSMHSAVPASSIVLAGDSAGGNLSFALLQLLLQFHRTSSSPKVLFHGAEVDIPLPAGATANSGWFDITRSMPSLQTNAKYDYLPPVSHDSGLPPFKSDGAWPADPPRGDLFCDLSLIDHPLVSPLAAPDWSNSPPLWLSTGWEMLYDEDAIVASRAASQGTKVVYEEFEAMPHCFQLLMPTMENSSVCYNSWGDFCRRCVEEPEKVVTRGRLLKAKGGGVEDIEIGTIGGMGIEGVRELLKQTRERRVRGFEKKMGGQTKSTL